MLCNPIKHLSFPCLCRRRCDECIDHTLQPVDGRAFDQHPHICRCALQGFRQRTTLRKPLPDPPEALYSEPCKVSDGEQALNSVLTREHADFSMRALGKF